MKSTITFAIVLVSFLCSCVSRKMPLDTVYDLPPSVFPLKLVAMREWSSGKHIYTFEDPQHNSISRIYKTDPTLKIGKVVSLEDLK